MRHATRLGLLIAVALLAPTCAEKAKLPVESGYGPDPALPPPDSTWIPTIDIAPARGWDERETPVVAPGFEVEAFARELDHPRWLAVLRNGDVLVAETNAPPGKTRGPRGFLMKEVKERSGGAVPSANRITLLRDVDRDGTPELRSVFLEDLHSPFGMAQVGDDLYVANTDALLRFPLRDGDTRPRGPGEKVADLPAGSINRHWTKNVIASAGGSRVYASGLRNPVGMSWQPESGALWTAVNERDEIGGDLVPDYMTAVHEGGFYGWPYSYYGQHVDRRVEPQRRDLVEAALVPDYGLGAHTASLGLVFYRGDLFPRRYAGGAFVGQHGSWNRKPLSGYKVIFVPFEDGRPAGAPEDFLTGFVDEVGDAKGRPVGVAVAADGALLVADDVGNAVWRVTPVAARSAAHDAPR